MTEVSGAVESYAQAENKPTLGRREIAVGPNKVRVSWAEFRPQLQTDRERELFDPTKAVVFLPGWPWKADKSVTWSLPRSLSKKVGVTTFSIDTRSNKKGPEALYVEAEGIAEFIKQSGLKEVTLFGHSEGAIRVADLAVILERNYPEIKINGVVMANPMGLDQRSIRSLAKDFFLNILKVQPKVYKEAGIKPAPAPAGEFMGSLLKDIADSWLLYPLMLTRQLKNLVTLNPNLSAIKSAVAILATDRDLVSNISRYLSAEGVAANTSAPIPDEQLKDWIETERKWERLDPQTQGQYGNKEAFVQDYMKKYRIMEARERIREGREVFLKENVFTQAQDVDYLVGTKLGDHTAIPDARYETAANIVYGMFHSPRRGPRRANP